MHLYLMRHAEAEKISGMGPDSERPLTSHGRSQARRIGEELKRRKVCPLIICSPFRRTVQTAQILSEQLTAPPPRPEALLASSGRAPELRPLLRKYGNATELLLIGHEPDLGMLATQLLGFDFGFSTGTLVGFQSDTASKWVFAWTLAPETLPSN